MQYREYRVNRAERSQRPVLLAGEEPIRTERRVKNNLTRVGSGLNNRQRAVIQRESTRVGSADQPLAILGDTHRNRLKTLGIKCIEHASR